MPTIVTTQDAPTVEPTRHRVQESAEEAIEAVKQALAANLKFVTFTRQSGKKFSVLAAT